VRELDFTADVLRFLIGLAADLKLARATGTESRRLAGKCIAPLREAFTRARCAFEVAAYDEGGHVTYLGPTGTHIGREESVKDTARASLACRCG
jgi:ornithine carbamoyltransferase